MTRTSRNMNRLDVELVSRGLAVSREKAQALIMAGEVRINGERCDRADKRVHSSDNVEIQARYPYVSRGAFKLRRALDEFHIEPEGKVVLDIGISNGGFADLMLQCGAVRVIGVDVNINQVNDKLRNDPRVTLVKRNARSLTAAEVTPDPQIITMDLSFISVTKVIPALSAWPGAVILCMVKPQFEAERHQVHKGGVIRSAEERARILLRIRNALLELHWVVTGVCPAGVRGRRGNQEYFFRLEYGKEPGVSDTILTDVVTD